MYVYTACNDQFDNYSCLYYVYFMYILLRQSGSESYGSFIKKIFGMDPRLKDNRYCTIKFHFRVRHQLIQNKLSHFIFSVIWTNCIISDLKLVTFVKFVSVQKFSVNIYFFQSKFAFIVKYYTSCIYMLRMGSA